MGAAGGPYSGALFRGVFEAVPDAVLVVDDEGRVVAANARCGEVFGFSPQSLVGRPVDELVPHGSATRTWATGRGTARRRGPGRSG